MIRLFSRYLFAPALVICLAAGNANALLIDSFDITDSATITDTPGAPPSVSTSSTADGTFAATRVTTASFLNGSGSVTVNAGPSNADFPPFPTGPFSTGYFSFTETSFANGSGSVSWTTGSGVDLTELGSNDALAGEVSAAQLGNTITFTVGSAGGTSAATVAIPNTSPFASQQVFALFNTFATTSGTGADFTDATFVSVSIGSASTSTSNLVAFDFFESTKVIPEPSSIALLGMGAFGLLGYGWRRKKKAVVEDVA